MPELPEIETVKLQLEKELKGFICKECEIVKARSVHGNAGLVNGKKVIGVRRKAKVLILDFEKGISAAFHFKMTGQLILITGNKKRRVVGGYPTADFTGELPSKHTRAIFHFDRGTMYFNDQRLFGWVKFGTTEEINNMDFLKKLGPEPLELTEKEFIGIIIKYKKPIKLVLMDQEILSGMGNIYANDALWEAGIDPKRPANSLTAKQLKALYRAVILALREGIKYGGATAADAKYINLHGMGGHYQEHFRVYDREGEECLRPDCGKAGGIIHRFALGGRGTYYCPRCQV